jgi:plastocyanin
MTWRWLICFSLGLSAAPPQRPQPPGGVRGEVELTNSRDPAVRRNKDYSGVAIWLEPVDRPAVAAPPRRVEVLQKDRHFQPHVTAIPLGGTVDFPNLDPIYHNAFSNFEGEQFDLGLYRPGTSKGWSFHHPGIVRVFCNIHPTMSAIILVLPTPWYALTPPTGKYNIPDVPPGDYQLHIFHERALTQNLRFLERRITVPEGGLALPLISISETGFLASPHLNKYGKEYAPVARDGAYPGAIK